MLGFRIPKIWQILKHFSRSFHQAWISYFWRVYMYVIARGETTSNMVFTLLASCSCISSGTNTFPINALAMSTAISHFTLVMSQLAFEAFPAGKASALTILVISVTWAQHWTHACNEKTMRNHYSSMYCSSISVFWGENPSCMDEFQLVLGWIQFVGSEFGIFGGFR